MTTEISPTGTYIITYGKTKKRRSPWPWLLAFILSLASL